MRASTRRWSSLCGSGVNSPLLNTWVGIGDAVSRRSAGVSVTSSESLTNRMRPPRNAGIC